jgi:dinuclear metal center YbgI/SA1388 family protein
MKLKEIVDFLDEKIPEDLALESDNVGLVDDYDLNSDIASVKIFMDLWNGDDDFSDDTLIIAHHPPLFTPENPTYVIHSNWDIIDGGANEALADALKLNVIDYFDDETRIGRICESDYTFKELKRQILENFENVRIVNSFEDNEKIKKIGIISGFGLKNPNYIKLACDKGLDVLISGDLTQESAIMAINLGIGLIDLGHHESEIPGLYALADILKELDIDSEVIDKKPIEKLM